MRFAFRFAPILGIGALLESAWPGTPPVTLPVPCLGSACAAGKFGTTGFVSAGQATATQSGTKLTVNQTSGNATLNWQSFNISANGVVQFVQPGASSVALNQINDANASQIFGALNANGRVFLINQNGIIFGAGAQVNVGGLVASTLNINPAAVTGGLIAAGSNSNPAFQSFSSGTSGAVTINPGATLQTSEGGQILIFAPTISNQGTISSPGGQTMLAAGNTIYLATNSDPSLRGLLVEVGGTGGTVTNGTAADSAVASPDKLIGQIIAQNGNVTLAGLAVNQLGRVSATTSINENGSIVLQASDHGSMNGSGVTGVSGTPQPGTGGTLVLGAHSDTEVTLDTTDPSTTVDSVPQLKSDIQMSGYNIQMLADSVARATSGTIKVTAEKTTDELQPSLSDGARFYQAPGAELDVSGASITLPVSINVIPVELRGAELADSPLQQNGPLRSQTVYVDIRQGTPLADISGEIAAIGHNVVERNLTGGTITIQSHGDAILAPGSVVDVAGGQIDYTGGYLNTTKLVTTTGQLVDIGSASPDLQYVGIANSTTQGDPKWGVSSTYQAIQPSYSPGYVEGKDAGTLNLSAPKFVFDGNADTATVTGIYQRLPDESLPAGSLYRPYDQVPQAATLVIGTSGSDFVEGNITLAPSLVLPGLLNADGTTFDPLSDPLPASYATSVLRPALLGAGGFGNVSIYADGKFLDPATVQLKMPAGGSFSVTAGLIDVEGKIDAPDGTISLTAGPTVDPQPDVPYLLTLGPQAALTARGEWINDNQVLYPDSNSAPLFIDGGSISITAQASGFQRNPGLDLARGSLIDVSGGGHLTSAGVLQAGVGGSIKIGADTTSGDIDTAPLPLVLGSTLRGYGLYEGASLSIEAGSVCIAVTNCSAGAPSTLWVSPAMLASGGFSSYALTADQGGLSVADGTRVTLQQQNLVLPNGYEGLPDQATLAGTATLAVIPDQLRQPVDLSLTQSIPATGISSLGANILTVTSATPSLTVGAGAIIQADPNARISLSSNVRILMDGTLSAPGGDISLDLTAGLPEATYDPTQAIWLGSEGVLNASGVAQIYLNSLGQRTGNVLDGGTVSLAASRGYIELLPGSLIDVAGTSAIVDETGVGGGVVRAEQVASAGGAVDLTAAEGMQLGGRFEAAAGMAGAGGNQPAGGAFSLTLDGSNRGDYQFAAGGGPSTFSQNARQVVVGATQPPVVVSPGYAVPDSLAGIADVSAGALQSAGFDTVSLTAASLPIVQGGTTLPGVIEFTGNVTLSAGRMITLDAASYSVSSGSTARILSPYVEFGNSEQIYQDVPAATAGTGTLDVAGGFIELYGTTSLQGVGTARFTSTGDLRLRGLLDLATSSPALDGALYAAGNIDLTAQQIYPSTLSQFVISADPTSVADPTAGTILIQGSSASHPQLLSAGGGLTLSAGTVTQDGVLRAPFGAITIDAASIVLGTKSVTSTSADGLTIPFGTTQGGIDWVYPLPNGTQAGISVVYGTDGIAPPAQYVTLQGAHVDVRSGAVIDVAGGGNLQAYEWIDGPGGTNDVLSNSTQNGGRPNQFAILPTLGANVAPYDPNISAGSTLQVGDAVYLSGMAGLPAGVYQLLPARYALLPGAYLVTQVSGYQDIRSGQAIPVLGGGTIISGYETVAGTSFADSRTSGFDVVPASIVLQQAQYTTTGANQFFAAQAATAAAASGVPASTLTPRLPQDSGVLALIASGSLTLDGTLRTAAAAGGLGAEVDISSADILVTSGASTAPAAGQVLITTASLNTLGAQTLLLGGLRTDGAIDTTAQTVEIAAGADLTAPLVLLAAQDQISVDSGASITAAGSAPGSRTYTLTGDGAFLSASAGSQSTVTRTGTTGAAGVLNLAPGSSITAKGGAVYLDASNNVLTGGNLSLAGADLAVQSPDIVLGAAPAGVVGTVLGTSVLGAQGLRNLLLQSGAEIDVYGSVTASARNITLDAPGLAGYGTQSDSAVLSASNGLTLQNSQAGVAAAAGTGTQALTLSAPTVTFGGGTFAASGFGSLAIKARDTLTASADGAISTSGDLTLTASRITTDADVNLDVSASGGVSLLAPAQPAKLAAATDLGGSLAVTGASIDVDTQIAMPSGRVVLTTTGTGGADGSLTVGPGGAIDVAGIVQQYDATKVATPGGAVSLASAGNIALDGGSLIDVSSGSGGQGGSLAISAATGTVSLAGKLAGTGAAGRGASFSIDAQGFGDFAALTHLVNTGGFSGGQSVRLRGAGDLIVAAGSANAITADHVSLEADQGRIVVDGVIDAAAPQGGSVTLAAADDLIVNGTINAQATSAGQNGGAVQLETTQGRLLLDAGSSINVSGGGSGADGAGAGGSVLLRVPSTTVAAVQTGGGGVALNGTIVGSSRTTLEAYAVYQNTTGVISATDMSNDPAANPIYAAAANLMTNAATITGLLGQANNSAFVLEPGVEIDATVQSNGTGTLELDSPWNLNTWRFGATGNVPGILTLRAQNGITFNASLSDGFAATSGDGAFTLPTQASSSWSYRIVAGADSSAANPLTVNAANPADVTIAACGGGSTCNPGTSATANPNYAPNMIRTGDGFIDVSASGNFVLGDQASLLYTAGVASSVSAASLATGKGSLRGLAYPTDGGDIQIDVAGNVQGAVTDQFVTDWLWRVGSTTNAANGTATAWTVDFQGFQQGVAALAGGNVSVSAGGDVTNLSVSIPTVGIPVGGSTNADNIVSVQGGGRLSVTAGGSILGGSYYVGSGSAVLQAGGDVGAISTDNGGTGLSPIIGLGNASLDVTARGDLQLSEILNPTLLYRGALQGSGGNIIFFSTYGANSSASLTAIGGTVTLNDDNTAVEAAIGPSFLGGLVTDLSSSVGVLDTLPQTLNVYALSGSVDLGRVVVLAPSPNGNLQIFANQNVVSTVNSGTAGELIISDADPSQLPSPAAPQNTLQIFNDIASALNSTLPDQHASTPVFLSADQSGAMVPAQIVAENGSVEFQPNLSGNTEGIWSAKPVQVYAGLDVVDLNLVAQNLTASDVTSITAGRDIIYSQQRLPNGEVAQDTNGIAIDGPGQLQLTAGRNVNLGTSNGVATRANLVNPVLPATGASISVQAGVGTGTPAQYAAFINQYINGSSQFDPELVAFVQAIDGSSGLTAAQARQQFNLMTPQLERTFVEELFFDLLRIYGSEEAATGNGNYTGAFAAISALFPGANPNLAKGQTNPYGGDIDLYFSRIYTEQGGNISLFAPGGGIDVGLALAPASFGIDKAPDQLGIVAQTSGDVEAFSYGDFQVNQSRVFAADGGDILVWSTEGNIDAGRGAKTAISAPALNIAYDANGQPTVSLRAAIAGSGIQALTATPGISPGNVYLFAPHGVVNADDAGIVAGNLTVAATAVLGANNITVSGTSVGVPPLAPPALGATFAGASSTAGAASNVAESFNGANAGAGATPVADAAIGWLDVFVTGLGEEDCKPDDIECLKRQSIHAR
jgi:filamentous hemagglutinin family protein